jgi:heme O synthase-like polyprenyltransferase
MTTEVQDAELEVARTKQRFQQSLQLAGETGSRLAVEMRRKATPALIAVMVVGGAVVAGAAFVVTRGQQRDRSRSTNRPSPTGMLARAVGLWLLRAAALRLAEALAAKFRDSTEPVIASSSQLQ